MGKKKDQGLAGAIIRNRFGNAPKNRHKRNRHSPMRSKLEESDFDKINFNREVEQMEDVTWHIVNRDKDGLLTTEEKAVFEEAKNRCMSVIGIPRRPPNARSMTKEELHEAEKDSYLNWRRKLAQIESMKGIEVTPFECNLNFWRQLWRVIERSDVLIQVVDARNPLLFRNTDLEKYVKEVNSNKINMLMVNKADFLTDKQREIWAKYFDECNIRVIFWSAKVAEEKNKTKNCEKIAVHSSDTESIVTDNNVHVQHATDDSEEEEISKLLKQEALYEVVKEEIEASDDSTTEYESASEGKSDDNESFCLSDDSDDDVCEDEKKEQIKNSPNIVSIAEFIQMLESMTVENVQNEGMLTIGLIGYPNVGKSSTINAIYGRKKASVSATPGHTKHFQTLIISSRIVLCDCPGLVMPSIVHSKAALAVSGIIPIDTLRDYVSPINLICSQFPRETLEAFYSVNLPIDEDNPTRPPTGNEFLTHYACTRGMMSSKGVPNRNTASREILKDYVDGRLLYRHPPPGYDINNFGAAFEVPAEKMKKFRARMTTHHSTAIDVEIPMFDTIKQLQQTHVVGIVRQTNLQPAMERINKQLYMTTCDSQKMNISGTGTLSTTSESSGKYWRQHNKEKRCKHQKMRVVNSHLDKHGFVYD